jgi:hypothetical protein
MVEQTSGRRGFVKGIVAGLAGAFFVLRGAEPVEAAGQSTMTVLRARTRFPDMTGADAGVQADRLKPFYRALASEPRLRPGQLIAMEVLRENYGIRFGDEFPDGEDYDALFLYFVYAAPNGKRSVWLGGHITSTIDDPFLGQADPDIRWGG